VTHSKFTSYERSKKKPTLTSPLSTLHRTFDLPYLSLFILCSLLGLGYSLNDLIEAAEETRKIKKSRQANMKGTWDKFRRVFDRSIKDKKKKLSTPKTVVARSG